MKKQTLHHFTCTFAFSCFSLTGCEGMEDRSNEADELSQQDAASDLELVDQADIAASETPSKANSTGYTACDIFSTDLVNTAPGTWATVTGWFVNLPPGDGYKIYGSMPGLQPNDWKASTYSVVRASKSQPMSAGFFVNGVVGTEVKLEVQPPSNSGPGRNYPVTIQLYSPTNSLVCTDTVTVRTPMACNGTISWWNSASMSAGYDGANCYITAAPTGSNPFVANNKYYTTPTPGTTCPLGNYDGANCFVQVAPPRNYISNNTFYTLNLNGCPPQAYDDGSGCVWDVAPSGTTAFKWDGNWYTTPLNNNCSIGTYDGVGCYIGTPPSGTVAFIWANNFYYAEQ